MFADRLNMLFEDSPRFGRPVTQAVVADGLAASGSRLSRPYLSQLRRSRRTNPSPDVVGVSPLGWWTFGETALPQVGRVVPVLWVGHRVVMNELPDQ